MKKFQKILSTGLILAHVCQSSLAFGTTPTTNSNQSPFDSYIVPDGARVILVKSQCAPTHSSIFTTFFNLARLGLWAAVGLQLVCANCSAVQLALAGYADTSSFKFSEYVRPHASLARLGESIDLGFLGVSYFDKQLICQEITGGFANAANIAVLGFAKDIYVMHPDSNQFEFYYMPGNYGLTSVDACRYLQHLIDKVTAITKSKCATPEKVKLAEELLTRLHTRKEFLSRCVSYRAWNAAHTYAAKLASFVVPAVTSASTRGTTLVPQEETSANLNQSRPRQASSEFGDPDSADAYPTPACDSSDQNDDGLKGTLTYPSSSDGSSSIHSSFANLGYGPPQGIGWGGGILMLRPEFCSISSRDY